MASLQSSFMVILLVGLAVGLEINGGLKHFHCTKEGRFEDPKDCGSFINCVPDGNGGLKSRLGSCHGRAYDPIAKRCIELKNAEDCKPRKGRYLPVPVPSYPSLDSLCAENKAQFVCADCKTLVICVNGTAYPEPCGDQRYFCAEKDEDFKGAVCYPNEPEDCTCNKPNSFKQDPYGDKRFLFCEKENTDPLIYQCPKDYKFDLSTKQCSNKEGLPECDATGVFADPNSSCTRFYTCILTTSGWIQKSSLCPDKLLFNEASGMCENPCDWDDGNFKCSEEGRFPDPLHCQNYYECTKDGEDFHQVLRECPKGYVWDPKARENFGYCVLAGTRTEPCKTVKPNKCSIPDDYCEAPSLSVSSTSDDEDVSSVTEAPNNEDEG